MPDPLHPCPECGRHIRTDEEGCPFCDAEDVELPDARDMGTVYGLPPLPDDIRFPAAEYGGPPRSDEETGLA